MIAMEGVRVWLNEWNMGVGEGMLHGRHGWIGLVWILLWQCLKEGM